MIFKSIDTLLCPIFPSFNSQLLNLIVCTVHLTESGLINHEESWVSHVARMKEGRNVFKISSRKRRVGRRPMRRWEDNIGKDLKEIGIDTRNEVIRSR